MKIGGLEIKQNIPLFLAPMAGVTDMTFRMLCREEGADVTCTEMVSAKALSYNNRNTFELLRTSPGERPAAVQLFGSDPALMAEMAQTTSSRMFSTSRLLLYVGKLPHRIAT